jgi:hypothetical protein
MLKQQKYALIFRATARGNITVRIAALTACLVTSSFFGFYLGSYWQTVKNYETYIFPFSRYSSHLRSIAEQQDLAALTNAVIAFDKKFNARQDARDLEDAVNQAFKYGKK